ncbi:hypothetical protein EAF04_007679 [Stromatinia cepivora]|nr:hypothetical protein EAF04_007679 [Stromatinia cepivora]
MLSRYWNLLSLLACVEAVAASLAVMLLLPSEISLPDKQPAWELLLIDDSILRGAHSRFATTSMKYRLPAVTLEDIELHVKNIMCSESTIIIDFPSSNLLTEAEMEWKDLSEVFVISSHAGCNGEGARAPYLVSNVDYVSKSNSAVLSVKRLEWSDTYDTMEVKFGMGLYESSSFRVHGDLRKRTTTIVSVTPSETIHQSMILAILYLQILISALSLLRITAGANETLSIKCANCSIEGSIELTQGVFTISNSSLDTQKAVNFLEHGYFDAVVNGLGAHIETDAAIAGTFTESFNMSLVTLTLPGFQIPEIAAIGPIWVPTIRGAISVSTTLDFTYGFEVTVPDDSSIRLNIGNLSDSTSHGFNNTSVTALPLTATDPSIALTLALHSEILLGVNILSGRGSIAAGAFLDLPALSVSITQLSSVDKNCNPAQNAFLSPSQNLDSIDIFSSLTNIVPKAEIALGLEASAQLAIPEINSEENGGTTATLAGTAMLLPTACLSFDGKLRAFVSPTATGTAGSSSGDSKKSANAGVQLSAPLALAGDMGSLYWTAGMMAGVVFVALGL